MSKISKNLKISSESNRELKTISEVTSINEGSIVELLIHDYAIRIGVAYGEESPALSAHVLGGIRQNEKNSQLSMPSLNAQFEHLKVLISGLTKSLKEIEENSYVDKDILNVLLLYLKPESEIPQLPSTDIKLNISNKNNIHPFVQKSMENRVERIRSAQVNNAEKI